MRPRDVVELFALAALWGGSFLFMRIAGPAFGPVALVLVRVAGASLLLLPLLALRGQLAAASANWRPILAVGICNSALPFVCFAYATLTIEAGVAAIFNCATPLFAAIVARVWLGDRLTRWRVIGLVIGFGGVVWIAVDRAGLHGNSALLATVASLVAAVSYAVAPSLTKLRLAGVPPLAVAAGSQVGATLVLLVPAVLSWPAVPPSVAAWATATALAFACTGLAYLLYFRLIANAGPQNAVSVTYLVPIFAVVWGAAFLGERLTWSVGIGCAVVFLGTALATGVLRPRAARAPSAVS